MSYQIIEVLVDDQLAKLIERRKALYEGRYENLDSGQWEAEVHEINRSLAMNLEVSYRSVKKSDLQS